MSKTLYLVKDKVFNNQQDADKEMDKTGYTRMVIGDQKFINEEMKRNIAMDKEIAKLNLPHFHRWKLEKETSCFATNIRSYKCYKCGKDRVMYQPWGFKKEFELQSK